MEIQKILNQRGRTDQYTLNKILRCIDHTADRYRIDRYEVGQIILKYLTENNYIGVRPALWDLTSKKRERMIEIWNETVAPLSIPPKRTDRLRVCTFNVHYWMSPDNCSYKIEEMLNLIKEIDADVVCLQEAILPLSLSDEPSSAFGGLSSEKFIDAIVNTGYKEHRACDTGNKTHTGVNEFFGNAILSKIRFDSGFDITFSPPNNDRCYTTATIKANGLEITIVSVHLDVYDETEETRLTQVNEMINDLTNINNVIICGDFNALQRSDYTDNEWTWIAKNNRNVYPHIEATDAMAKEYKEAFSDNQLKYTVWSGRRVDYVWYRGGNLQVDRANVAYNPVSDHFPLIVDFVIHPREMPSLTKGLFDCLMWTHNTPYETIYKMITGEFNREIRCCFEDGRPVGRGAQFRYGIDSQYGDMIFVMKATDWWKKVKGVEFSDGHGKIIDEPLIGQVFKDFMRYEGIGIHHIERIMRENAYNYHHRSKTASGNGTECMNDSDISWCNLQLQSGTAIGLDLVELVLFPRWMLTDNDMLKNLEYGKEMIDLISNQLPYFPDGTVNLLNGKFKPYGPEKAADAYQYFRQIIKQDDEWIGEWYSLLDPNRYKQYGSTTRDPTLLGGSNRISISAEAFNSAEKIYSQILIRGSRCQIPPSQYLLYLVPAFQPILTDHAKVYGGYHITLFASSGISGKGPPQGFNLVSFMRSFKKGKKRSRWALPKTAEMVKIGNLHMIIKIETKTTDELLKYLQRPIGPFESSRANKGTLHITLGPSESRSEELFNLFMSETEWALQLVEKIRISANLYEYRWIPEQRVPFYTI